MALIDDVQTVCHRLAPHGWEDLLGQHGLDITASNLAEELARELPGIRRDLPGFEDFAMEGERSIEPGRPARSLLFHALNLLIMSARSVVAERCMGLKIPHSKRVFCSLYCPLLQGIACGLGSN
ncbi:MAG TPA: hypothetical protein VHF46_02885 [Rubrobacteraceae bacterium]|nr:hypothetical protein [Rubrobacteraceae bacterium]